ncbi:MAG TPA: hypothetical protein VGM58_06415 [Verrucomicrobiae bacterium]|jgi:hypothetical protein
MKTKIFAALFGIAIATAGCVNTVTDTKTMGVPLVRDSVQGRYQRPLDDVYRAAVTVVNNNGVVTTEFIPHDTTNAVRSLEGKLNQGKVWVRVEAIDPQTPVTQVTVQVRTHYGGADVDSAHELEKEIALQLAR